MQFDIRAEYLSTVGLSKFKEYGGIVQIEKGKVVTNFVVRWKPKHSSLHNPARISFLETNANDKGVAFRCKFYAYRGDYLYAKFTIRNDRFMNKYIALVYVGSSELRLGIEPLMKNYKKEQTEQGAASDR